MSKGPGRSIGLSLALLIACALAPVPLSAQVVGVGGHFAANLDAREEVTWGMGPRVQLSDPMFGFSLLLSYDFYSPDCGALKCDLDEFGVGLLWSLPFPYLLDPYLGAGVAFQKWEGLAYEGREEETAFSLLIGIALQGRTFERFRPFVEGKYQTGAAAGDQKVISGGILLSIL